MMVFYVVQLWDGCEAETDFINYATQEEAEEARARYQAESDEDSLYWLARGMEPNTTRYEVRSETVSD